MSCYLQPDVLEGLLEIHRILKPCGKLYCIEPHQESLYNLLRVLWYKFDTTFAANEEAVSISKFKQQIADLYKFEDESYGGGPAYFLILNSIIFRLPMFNRLL